MSTHAILSPSGADGWMVCPGWENGGESTVHNRVGTAKHEIGYLALSVGNDAAAYLGRVVTVDGDDIEIDEDAVESVQEYIDLVRSVRDATGGELMVEVKVPIEHITGEEGARGTADAVILTSDEIIVIDYKSGYRRVEADRNRQLMLYALGALRQFELMGDFKRVRLMISQPTAGGAPSEWDCSIEELLAFGEEAKMAALKASPSELVGRSSERNPGADTCRYCKHKATCSAVVQLASQTITFEPHMDAASVDDFTDLDEGTAVQALKVYTASVKRTDQELIAKMLPHLELIEDWVAAVRARAQQLLNDGVPVPGYKLVAGKRGPRRWSNADEAEAMLKAMRLKQEEMYSFKLISPTTADKLTAAGKLGKRQWAKLQALVTQKEPGLSVAPVSDKRQAVTVTPTAEAFENLDAQDLI